MSIIIPGQPASYYSFGNGILGLNGYSFQAQPPVPATTAYELTLENDGHGTVSASTLSGFPGDSATLSTTPSTDYEFSGYDVTGGTIEGNTFIYGNTDATAIACFKQSIVNLTLQTDGHGTLTATSITGRPGDTVTLTPTYNTYYRFSGYQTTGGTVNGNTYTFGTAASQTAKANFKVNNFTATGNFNFSTAQGSKTVSKTYTGLVHARTGELPAGWGSNGNTFVPSNASAYKITCNTTFAGVGVRGVRITGTFKVGSTSVSTKTAYRPLNNNYAKETTSVNINASTSLQGTPYYYCNVSSYGSNTAKISTMSPNGWTATGYAP